MPFSTLGLRPEVLGGVRALGFERPTPIQIAAIPPAVAGRDLVAGACTGSGKTAAFALPILQRLVTTPRRATRALVLTPTRELAGQIEEHFRELAQGTAIRAASIYGGVGMQPQERAFRSQVDVIVATPGRLLDHLRFPYARLDQIEVVVLDEADRMLDLGFLPDVKRILSRLPAVRQTLLFSATLPAPIVALAKQMLREPVRIDLAGPSAPAVGIRQHAYSVASDRKPALLVELLKRGDIRSVIAFTRTKRRADRLADQLVREGVKAGRIHGNRSQSQRLSVLRDFKAGALPVLVATDLAARGIDVDALSHVVNFDVPPCTEDYVHRVGRTGRAGAQGDALVFVSPEEEEGFRRIERSLGGPLPRLSLPGFVASSSAPRVAVAPRPSGRPSSRPGSRPGHFQRQPRG
jgi:ATP-dependent RNA helicase RhlE